MEWVKNGSEQFEGEKTWKPEGPAELTGKLIAKSTINLPEAKGGPTVLLKLEDEKGQVWAIWASRMALKELVEKYDDALTVGREIGIRCLDKVKTAGGNDFVPYEIGFGGASAAQLASVGASAGKSFDDEPF